MRWLVVYVLVLLLCGVSRSQSLLLYPWRPHEDSEIPKISVNENMPIIPIAKVMSDKFVRGQGLYKLEGPGVDQEPKNLFEIDEIKGDIWTKQSLDREKDAEFTVKVSAESPTGEILESPTPIKIVVIDLNDNSPVFTQPVFYGSVPELSPPGTLVMTVSATDADQPLIANTCLSYSIIDDGSIPANATNKGIFEIDWFYGGISTKAVVPDREVVKVFRLRLRVGDLCGAGLTDEAVAIINVTDTNNNVPEFSPTSYHMTVVENTLGDIGRVNVTDGDEPGTGNWEAKFSISDDPHGYCTIRTDAETNQGILSVVKPLDFETVTELTLTLRVENIKPLSSKAPTVPVSTATVIVTVVNHNEAPYFTDDPIKLVVHDDALPGTSLKSDIAIDPENLGMSFEITKDPEDWIEINNITGEILAKRRFNTSSVHVKNNIYTVGVKVTDAGGLYTTANVQITLVETNDFAPRLSPLSGTVCKNGGNFSSGLVLTAVDEDFAPHAEPFSFETPWMLSTDIWNVTQVNDTHAVLQLGVDLESGVYQVTVMVSDSGTPTLNSSAQVNVIVCQCDSSGHCQSHLESGMSMGVIIVIVIVAILVSTALVWMSVEGVKAFKRRQIIITKSEEDGNPRDKFIMCQRGGGAVDGSLIVGMINSTNNASPPISNDPQGMQAPQVLPSSTQRGGQPADGSDEDVRNKNSIDLSLPTVTGECDADNRRHAPTGPAADPASSPSPELMYTEDSSYTSSSSGSLSILSDNGLMCEVLTGASHNLAPPTYATRLQAALTDKDFSDKNTLNPTAFPAMGKVCPVPTDSTEVGKDAPQDLPAPTMSCGPEAALCNIEDLINERLETANKDSNVPVDMKQIYDYEGDGSRTGSLSSIYSSSSGVEQDFDYLNELGPRFQKLADLYVSHD